jgi:hypothetical protein
VETAQAAGADIAVLVRSGYRANDLVSELRRRHIPVTDWRGDTYELAERRAFITVWGAQTRSAAAERDWSARRDRVGG